MHTGKLYSMFAVTQKLINVRTEFDYKFFDSKMYLVFKEGLYI